MVTARVLRGSRKLGKNEAKTRWWPPLAPARIKLGMGIGKNMAQRKPASLNVGAGSIRHGLGTASTVTGVAIR